MKIHHFMVGSMTAGIWLMGCNNTKTSSPPATGVSVTSGVQNACKDVNVLALAATITKSDASKLTLGAIQATIHPLNNGFRLVGVDFTPLPDEANSLPAAVDYVEVSFANIDSSKSTTQKTADFPQDFYIDDTIAGVLRVTATPCLMPYKRTTASDCGKPSTSLIQLKANGDADTAAVMLTQQTNTQKREQQVLQTVQEAQSYLANTPAQSLTLAATTASTPAAIKQQSLYVAAQNLLADPYGYMANTGNLTRRANLQTQYQQAQQSAGLALADAASDCLHAVQGGSSLALAGTGTDGAIDILTEPTFGTQDSTILESLKGAADTFSAWKGTSTAMKEDYNTKLYNNVYVLQQNTWLTNHTNTLSYDWYWFFTENPESLNGAVPAACSFPDADCTGLAAAWAANPGQKIYKVNSKTYDLIVDPASSKKAFHWQVPAVATVTNSGGASRSTKNNIYIAAGSAAAIGFTLFIYGALKSKLVSSTGIGENRVETYKGGKFGIIVGLLLMVAGVVGVIINASYDLGLTSAADQTLATSLQQLQNQDQLLTAQKRNVEIQKILLPAAQ